MMRIEGGVNVGAAGPTAQRLIMNVLLDYAYADGYDTARLGKDGYCPFTDPDLNLAWWNGYNQRRDDVCGDHD
jgi:ribosome modulation factor